MGNYRGAEWIVDCYRMRVNDDVEWGSMKVHGITQIAFQTEDMNGPQLSKKEKTFIITKDFLFFLKLAVRNQVMPESFPYPLCLGYFAPNLLHHPFCKQDAKDKWGGENIFSIRPSLRRTAELVYGLSCMCEYNDQDAQAQGELAQQQVMADIDVQLGDHQDLSESNPGLFENVGGKTEWVSMMKLLQWNM